MQKPRDRGNQIDNRRFDTWLANFSGYVFQVTRGKIELWLNQFDKPHKDIAARLLDSVVYIGQAQIQTRFRELLRSLEGWNDDPAKRKGRWFFVPFSGSTGESGDTMVHFFRMANGMSLKKYNSLFVHRSDLIRQRLTPEDTVVLIDDFSGTGRQAKQSWKEVFAELLVEEPRVILLLAAATEKAVQEVRDNTDMQLICGTLMNKSYDFFDSTCKYFNASEKNTIERYSIKADKKNPRGSGNSGLLVVLAHRCPNNSLPILFANHNSWAGLFPRS